MTQKKIWVVAAVVAMLALAACNKKQETTEPAASEPATEQVAKEAETAAQEVVTSDTTSQGQEASEGAEIQGSDDSAETPVQNADSAEAKAGEDQQY